MPATVLFSKCKSYVIVGIYASISEFPLMCGDVRFSGTPVLIISPLTSRQTFAHDTGIWVTVS